jgi:hypothetical protein
MAGKEPIRGSDFIPIDLVVSTLDINEDEFPIVSRAKAWLDLAFVDLITSMGDLLSLSIRMGCHCHEDSPSQEREYH